MSTVAFDTLKFAQTPRDKAKLSPEQAEGISEAFAAATTEQLATKADVALLKADIATLEARMDTRFKEVQLVIGSMIVGLGGILVGIKFLGH